MPDYFALLNEPRRPWLDPEILRQKFLTLSAAVHPDRVHSLGQSERAAAQEKYVALNAAYSCLRLPKDRLRHLLELETGAAPGMSDRIPADLMNESVLIGNACREADQLLATRKSTSSPLLKVRLFEQSQQQIEKLQRLAQGVAAQEDELNQVLRIVDTHWTATTVDGESAGRAELLRRIEDLYRVISFIGRSRSQLQERLTALSF